jgi:hypothetical protein
MSRFYRDGVGRVRRFFPSLQFGRRVIALFAAYAIALSGLIGNFGTARGVAGGDTGALFVICHGVSGATASSPDKSDGGVCDNGCCIGCLSLGMASLPAPAATLFDQQIAGNVSPLRSAVLAGYSPGKSHRSRAPPQTA